MKNVRNLLHYITKYFIRPTLLSHQIIISKRNYVLHKNRLDQSVSNYTIAFNLTFFIILESYYKKNSWSYLLFVKVYDFKLQL